MTNPEHVQSIIRAIESGALDDDDFALLPSSVQHDVERAMSCHHDQTEVLGFGALPHIRRCVRCGQLVP